MTEEQIERAVERQFDSLDRQFLADGSKMTQAEYDAACKEISAWADNEYQRRHAADWLVSHKGTVARASSLAVQRRAVRPVRAGGEG